MGSVAENGEIHILDIRGRKLYKLSRQIKPVVYFTGLGLCYIKPVHPRVAFLRDPEFDAEANNLKHLCDITTFHVFANRNYFNPTAAEVFGQIPAETIDKVAAFEIGTNPEKDGGLNQSEESLKAGYHTATTRLYTRKE